MAELRICNCGCVTALQLIATPSNPSAQASYSPSISGLSQNYRAFWLLSAGPPKLYPRLRALIEIIAPTILGDKQRATEIDSGRALVLA